jgi:transposase InsO family protein
MITIEYNKLLEYGLSENTIVSGCKRFRKGLSSSWNNKLDSTGTRVVVLDSIPEATRTKYGIPSGNDYLSVQIIEQNNQDFEATKAKEEKEYLYNAYFSNWINYVSLYSQRYAYNKKTQLANSQQSAKDHAFWLAMVEVTGSTEYTIHGKLIIGYDYYKELKKQVALTVKIDSIQYFKRYVKSIRTALHTGIGIEDLIADNAKKERETKKTGDLHKALVLQILSNPQRLAYRVATDLVNHHCQIEGFPTISESWIKKLMATDNIFKTAVDKCRYGKKYFNDNILPHQVRKITPYPANVWMIDGTPIQFFCWNATRTKQIRLYLFAVIDVCSRKIVGFDISYSEDKFSVMNALKMAVLSEGHLPAEIVSDNFSANKTEEIIELKTLMEKIGTIWRLARVGNAQDKGYIERFFGAFQSVECALYEDYIGEGMGSTRLNAKPNQEYQAKIAKMVTPTEKEMKYRIAKMIAKYNERSSTKKQSPNEVYKIAKPNAKELDAFGVALLFWKKTSYTVKRGMVKITVRKQEYSFEIYEHKYKMELRDKKVTVRYDEHDLDRVMLFDEFDVAICECRKSIAVNIASIDRTDTDILNTIKVSAKNKSYENYIENYKQDIVDSGLKSAKQDYLEIVHPLSLEKNQINSEESKHFLEMYTQKERISPKDEEKPVKKELVTIAQTGIKKDTRDELLKIKDTKNRVFELVKVEQ